MSFFEAFFTLLGILFLLGLLRFFFRFLWPVIRQVRALNKAQQDFLRQAERNAQERRRDNRREGDITVERTGKPAPKTIIRDGIGETVEYEEVE